MRFRVYHRSSAFSSLQEPANEIFMSHGGIPILKSFALVICGTRDSIKNLLFHRLIQRCLLRWNRKKKTIKVLRSISRCELLLDSRACYLMSAHERDQQSERWFTSKTACVSIKQTFETRNALKSFRHYQNVQGLCFAAQDKASTSVSSFFTHSLESVCICFEDFFQAS